MQRIRRYLPGTVPISDESIGVTQLKRSIPLRNLVVNWWTNWWPIWWSTPAESQLKRAMIVNINVEKATQAKIGWFS
jgi:hypothetical protein